MVASEQPDLAAGLLLCSYPLHAPGRADQRTAHFPKLITPTLFLHGTRDPFGTIDEMRSATASLAAPHEVVVIEGAGHDLGGKSSAARVAQTALDAFRRLGWISGTST